MKAKQTLRVLGSSVVVAALATTTLPYAGASAAAAAKTSLVASSQDGTAFDFDEYTDGDLTVQVTDSIAGAVDVDDAQDLAYFWTVKPFGAATTVRVPATGVDTQTDDVNGEFLVKLPQGQAPGTYTLSAGLGPDATAARAIPSKVLLSVKAGNAALTLDDSDPLQVAAGTEHLLAGGLRLEDGTALAARAIDFDLKRGTSGSDPEADAGFLPAAPGPNGNTPAVTTSTQVLTGTDGTLEVFLSDPAEDGQGTELGGKVTVATATTPDIGNAAADTALSVDLVGKTPPAGSTAVLDGLSGDATPGRALTSKLTVTAPDDTYDVDPSTPGVQGDSDSDRDPVDGQVYSLTLDHGFFTTGTGALPSTVGDPAGDLTDLGQTLVGITDANGEVPLQVGIARDPGFDDDGLVTLTVSAVAGDLSDAKSADWDTTNPLNGHVEVALSPEKEQDFAVNPALAGDRTFYEVFARDQFGNPVDGKPIDLTYSGDLDDWDYTDDFMRSDLDTSGDIWVDSFEAGTIKITGTWSGAPSYTYNGTAGSTVTGTRDAKGSANARFYEIDFDASKYSIRSSATDVVTVGTAVSQTVRVVDQEGNPVRGYDVQFFRSGPDKIRGEAVANRVTNRRGEASYTFLGTALGRARVTAEITDGVSSRTLTQDTVFGSAVTAQLKGKRGTGPDRMTVSAKPAPAGTSVQLYRVSAGKLYPVRAGRLDRSGKVSFKLRDRNGRAKTAYVAIVRSTPKTVADQSNTINIR